MNVETMTDPLIVPLVADAELAEPLLSPPTAKARSSHVEDDTYHEEKKDDEVTSATRQSPTSSNATSNVSNQDHPLHHDLSPPAVKASRSNEEEEKDEDEEMASATRDSPTSSSSYSYTPSPAIAQFYPPFNESVPEVSATSIYYESTDSDSDSSKETPTPVSPDKPTTELAPSQPGVSSPKSTPAKTNLGTTEDKEESEDDDNDDDDDSVSTVAINKSRAKGRRTGCIMFQVGLVAVIISIVLLSMQIIKENNEAATIVTPTTGVPQHHDRTSKIVQALHLTAETIAAIEDDPDSPQSWAMDWMLQDPWWDTYTYSQERARQRFGLATLYYATAYSVSNGWIISDEASLQGFLSYEIHECEWLPTERLQCNDQFQLTFLNLDGLRLRGTVPGDVFELMAPNSLEHLALGHNEIRGTLATQVGMLHKLTHLDITQTQVTGPVPSEIGTCQALRTLAIQLNPFLQGTIPTQLGLLSSLEGLWWRNTEVAGKIPSELGLLFNLQVLELSGNSLTGTIPIELVSDPELTQSTARTTTNQFLNHTLDTSGVGLKDLRLGRNRLTGMIPPITGRAQSSLRALVLSANWFEAMPLPTHLASLVKLTSLQVGSNQWTGLIPSELGLLSAHLESLGMEENSFTGTIPSELLELTQLQHLYLDGNHGIRGKIVGEDDSFAPDDLSLGRLSNLKELTISDTPLSGTLTDSLCLISIMSFTCNPERLCGCDCQCFASSPSPAPTARQTTTIPTENPWQSPSINGTSTIPTENPWQSPSINGTSIPSLALTTISPTSLGNVQDDFVDGLPKYTRVGLLDAQGSQASALAWLFADPNVTQYSNTQRLQRFAMATLYYSLYGAEAVANETEWLKYERHECLWGRLDRSYATCKSQGEERVVLGLYLSPVGLQGSLPPDVAILSGLRSIQATGSNLNGVLPTELGLLPDLQTLSLQKHKLQGPVPSELGQCSSLIFLDLTSNLLAFQLPSELGLLTKLESLVAPENLFVGPLPEMLPGSLKTLDLSSNLFRGTIPIASWASSSVKSSLQNLNVGSNFLNGQLVSIIGQLAQLSAIRVSNSQLTGSLPSELGLLSRLTWLDTSTNGLWGTIPLALGELSDLQYLSLSNNQFRGSIPQQLGYLAQLNDLRLDGNAGIHGRIPDSLTNLSLTVLRVNGTAVAGRIPSGLCYVDDFTFGCNAWLCGCRQCPCGQV
jgi:Leucine-rich repeat (LRR) protein